MTNALVARRVQFSSCDECRRSRVACDAASKNATAAEDSASTVSCTRCANRRRQCTFKWMKENKSPKKGNNTRQRTRRRRASPTPSDKASVTHDDGSEDAVNVPTSHSNQSPGISEWPSPYVPETRTTRGRPSFSHSVVSNAATSPLTTGIETFSPDQLSHLDAQWLSHIYRGGFDTVFGSWMGQYSCPFSFGESKVNKYVSIIDLCGQLDRWMADDASKDKRLQTMHMASENEAKRDRQIDQSLRGVVAAFSARWLPLSLASPPGEEANCDAISSLWRQARRDMLRVINRPSYRSVISLFLFALTPIPTGVTDEEELDGISGQSCVHAALQQIQTLRARQRNLQFSGSKVSIASKTQVPIASPDSLGTSDFINAESTAYWAALTFDTSASLTLNCRSLLSSGLFGFEEEMSWQLVRTTAKMFNESTQLGLPTSLDMTDDRANQIIAAGAAWKLLGWKLTSVFKEALRDGHDESNVRKAYTLVVDSITEFNVIFRPLLEACQKRMHFLSQQTKLRWYSLMLHYHLSILMLVDIIEATSRYDLLADVSEMSTDAETTVLNAMVFGLQNTYTLTVEHLHGNGDSIDGQKSTVTVPLLAIDPYPHHVVAGVQLVRKAIDRDFRLGKIVKDSYTSLQATLEDTLSHLPQSSKSVQAARTKLSAKIAGGNAVSPHQDPYSFFHAQYAE